MTHFPATVLVLVAVAVHARTCPVNTFVTMAVSAIVVEFTLTDRDGGITIVILGFVELTTILPISVHCPLGVTGFVLGFIIVRQNAIAPEVWLTVNCPFVETAVVRVAADATDVQHENINMAPNFPKMPRPFKRL
jgi:hypothetical protein